MRRLERVVLTIAVLCLGVAAALTLWGCALRWDESGSSGTVIDLRSPAPCASPTIGGGQPAALPTGGSKGGDAP